MQIAACMQGSGSSATSQSPPRLQGTQTRTDATSVHCRRDLVGTTRLGLTAYNLLLRQHSWRFRVSLREITSGITKGPRTLRGRKLGCRPRRRRPEESGASVSWRWSSTGTPLVPIPDEISNPTVLQVLNKTTLEP